ncbi:unnamed protein product, partial [Phaeothamnion confervicola]
GTVLSLDGSSHLVATNVMSAVTGTAARAISFWAKLASTSTTTRTAFSYGDSSASCTLTMPGSSSTLYTVNSGTSTASSGTPITTTWQHIILSYSGGNDSSSLTTVYLNGVSAVTSSTAIFGTTGTSNPLNIGYNFTGSDSNFTGYISDFRVYPREITSSVISTMNTNGPNDGNITVTGVVTNETTSLNNGAIVLTVT